MNERIKHSARVVLDPGPVITISRECGCSASLVAEKLTEKINNKINDPAKDWKWISKEILNLASEELEIEPEQIRKLLSGEEKNFLDEIASSFANKYYIYDAKIKKVIEHVIMSFAVRGRVIIVGRGSEAISHAIPRSLHIKLFAPLSWRIEVISNRYGISTEEAKKRIAKVDNNRLKFRNLYIDKNDAPTFYDIEFNSAKFSNDEIVKAILRIAKSRSLLC